MEKATTEKAKGKGKARARVNTRAKKTQAAKLVVAVAGIRMVEAGVAATKVVVAAAEGSSTTTIGLNGHRSTH